MDFFPIFFSVVLVVHNQSDQIKKIVMDVKNAISDLVSDYELIIIDNASEDESITTLKTLTDQNGFPNLQVYALTKRVDTNTASWVGLENALGDFVAVIDPFIDDINFLPEMLNKAVCGADVVFANNNQKPKETFAYRCAFLMFNNLYRWFNGVNLAKEAPQYRILSKRVINFILQHPQPAITYRHLPATGGFTRVNLNYSAMPKISHTKRLGESINRGVRLLVSTTQGPMRLVTSLSLFGAIANIFYSVYVVLIAFIKSNVTPGWVSLSLQQSGMFFLISLVLLVLGEYILHMTRLSNDGPLYNIAQEFTSSRLLRHEKLNIEEVMSKPIHRANKIPEVV
ncbi:glycosyltransferase, group 2 family protein (glycan biosynthesis) [Legionella santicrucis]|uniref:Glycosyltransferase, group 2 family protein (Glycan biosynthesis) n=1 Tax=Legionella santicrucis TaxID=45074 RepID=A0A0W0Z4R3_9GAMM|nr:glycosyltransferase [Legionella santicrucis]KTD63702.1 glycosyltransferase, group 2 family protein (glycan biosynthesis) [Legionella santicrucis]